MYAEKFSEVEYLLSIFLPNFYTHWYLYIKYTNIIKDFFKHILINELNMALMYA